MAKGSGAGGRSTGGLSRSEQRQGTAFYRTLSSGELGRRLDLTRGQMRRTYAAAVGGNALAQRGYARLENTERLLIRARVARG